mgnify:FL=1
MPNLAFKQRLGYNRGRLPGSKNVLSTSIRQGLLAVWHQSGGVEGMLQWVQESSENRGQFYGYLTKVLPHELAESDVGQSIKIVVYGRPEQANAVVSEPNKQIVIEHQDRKDSE